jgi:hypothetical protein
MKRDDGKPEGPDRIPPWRRTWWKGVALVTVLFALTVGAAACGGGSSHASGSSSTSSGSETSRYSEALKYVQCLRTHGEPDIPDPSANGNIQAGSGSSANSSAAQAAAQACQKYAPPAPKGAAPGQNAQSGTKALEYAECMRAHGVTNYPDPSSNGVTRLSPNSGIDQNSATYQAASEACQKYAPTAPAGAPAGAPGS